MQGHHIGDAYKQALTVTEPSPSAWILGDGKAEHPYMTRGSTKLRVHQRAQSTDARDMVGLLRRRIKATIKIPTIIQNDAIEKTRETQNSVYFCLRLVSSFRDNSI
jgi:hypothetical protein